MSAVCVVGVDPGRTSTGLVLLRAMTGAPPKLIAWSVVTRDLDEDVSMVAEAKRRIDVGPAYMGEVLREVDRLVDAGAEAVRPGRVGVVVEWLVAPSSHLGGKQRMLAPVDPIGAGIVCGAVWGAVVAKGRCPVSRVRPGGNGSQLLVTYPDDLVTDGERRRGLHRPAGRSAEIRHARSAWDVALTGLRDVRYAIDRWPTVT
jgi:hypothetical protein